MRQVTVLLMLLSMPLFAGCLDEAPVDATGPTGAPETSETPRAFTWADEIAFDTRTCTGGSCALVVDVETDPTYSLGTPTSVEAGLQWDSGALELGFTLMERQAKGWSGVSSVVGPSPLRIETADLAESAFEYALVVWHPCKDYLVACVQAGPPTTFTVEGTITAA